jgi:hypothetical protein
MNYSEQDTREFILDDRQWPRDLRISHARTRLAQARAKNDVSEIKHWQRVLEANGVDK